MKRTIEQVERERASSCGRYHYETNSYDELFEYIEPVQCDCCGYWFDEDEVENIDGKNVCCHCKEAHIFDMERDALFDEQIELKLIYNLNKAS